MLYMVKENSFLQSRFEKLRVEHPKLDILDFLRKCRVEYLLNADLSKLVDNIVLKQIRKRIGNEIPYSGELENNFDIREYNRHLETFGKTIQSGLEEPRLKKFLELLPNDDLAKEIGNCALKTDDQYFTNLAESSGIDVDLLRFIVETPFIPTYRELSILDPDESYEVRNRHCLVCGQPIILGVYNQRKLFLLCKLCSSRIRVDQFRCTNCTNIDSSQLGFYMLEDQPELKLEYCKICRTYLKTVDEDRIGAVDDPLLFDLATLDFNSLAQEKKLLSPSIRGKSQTK